MCSCFSEGYKNKKPVVLRGALSSWEVLGKWNQCYLATQLGSDSQLEPTTTGGRCKVFVSTDNRRFSTANGMTEEIEMQAGELVEYVFSYPSPTQSLRHAGERKGGRASDLLVREPTSEPRRVYLRTHWLPDGLFCDITTVENIRGFAKLFFSPLSVESNETNSSSKSVENTASDHSDCVDTCATSWQQCSSVESVVSTPRETVSELSKEELKFSERIFRQSHMQLWLGTQGNTTPLHYDRNHGLLAQIIGSKRIELFSHSDTSYLYPDNSTHHLSRLNLREFDRKEQRVEALRKFPKFEEATRYRALLRPGDVLYIPPFWWHEVLSLENALSVTFPWDLEGNEEIPPIMLR